MLSNNHYDNVTQWWKPDLYFNNHWEMLCFNIPSWVMYKFSCIYIYSLNSYVNFNGAWHKGNILLLITVIWYGNRSTVDHPLTPMIEALHSWSMYCQGFSVQHSEVGKFLHWLTWSPWEPQKFLVEHTLTYSQLAYHCYHIRYIINHITSKSHNTWHLLLLLTTLDRCFVCVMGVNQKFTAGGHIKLHK